jgi:hypothetical protein
MRGTRIARADTIAVLDVVRFVALELLRITAPIGWR